MRYTKGKHLRTNPNMKTIQNLLASVKAALATAVTRLTEDSAQRERRELEAFLAGSHSVYDLEARQRQWDARVKRTSVFHSV